MCKAIEILALTRSIAFLTYFAILFRVEILEDAYSVNIDNKYHLEQPLQRPHQIGIQIFET
jgi:hypothetical protein